MGIEQQLVEKLREGSFRGIIFDFDGTILDIMDPLQRAIDEVFEYYSLTGDRETTIQEIGAVLETVQGLPFSKIILESYEIFKHITVLQHLTYLKKLRIAAKLFTKYLEYAKEAPFFSGVKPLIEKYLSTQYNLSSHFLITLIIAILLSKGVKGEICE